MHLFLGNKKGFFSIKRRF